MSNIRRLIIVDNLFKRYTIYLDALEKRTSVHCTECDEWVFEFEGDYLSKHTALDLFDLIVSIHDENKHGVLVEFEHWTESFK